MRKKTTPSCPRCNTSTCFAHKSGRCVILIDNNFGARKCPFYKPQGAAGEIIHTKRRT